MKFCIADVDLNLIIKQHNIALVNNMRPQEGVEAYLDNSYWETEKEQISNMIDIYPVTHLPPVGGQAIWETDTCTVRLSGEVEIRLYHDGIIKRPYAIYSSSAENDIKVWCDACWLSRYYHTNYLFNICALEKLLIQNNKIIFHSCYIKVGENALLFSGDSGAGKSTQGALWEKYMKAHVINGDRSVLGNQNGQWYAYGFPFSGTSGICHNVTSPLKGIIFLKKASENRMDRLDPQMTGRLLWSQITVNQWNAEFVDKALKLVDQIAAEIPIYQLCCTPDERAVICVKEMLGL